MLSQHNGSSSTERRILPGRHIEEYDSIIIQNGLTPAPFVYRATDINKNNRYFINGLESYSVSWHETDTYYILYIVKQELPTGGDSRLYYINIDFNNLASGNATVQYKQFQEQKEIMIPKGTSYTIGLTTVTTQQPEISIISHDSVTRKEYFLNGLTSWTVPASEFKGERHTVDITDDGNVFYIMHLLHDLYN